MTQPLYSLWYLRSKKSCINNKPQPSSMDNSTDRFRFYRGAETGCADGDAATWRWRSRWENVRRCDEHRWRCDDATMRSVTVSPKEGNAVVQSWERWATMGNHGQPKEPKAEMECAGKDFWKVKMKHWNLFSEDLFESLWSFNDQIISSNSNHEKFQASHLTRDIFLFLECACAILERWIRDELAWISYMTKHPTLAVDSFKVKLCRVRYLISKPVQQRRQDNFTLRLICEAQAVLNHEKVMNKSTSVRATPPNTLRSS